MIAHLFYREFSSKSQRLSSKTINLEAGRSIFEVYIWNSIKICNDLHFPSVRMWNLLRNLIKYLNAYSLVCLLKTNIQCRLQSIWSNRYCWAYLKGCFTEFAISLSLSLTNQISTQRRTSNGVHKSIYTLRLNQTKTIFTSDLKSNRTFSYIVLRSVGIFVCLSSAHKHVVHNNIIYVNSLIRINAGVCLFKRLTGQPKLNQVQPGTQIPASGVWSLMIKYAVW